jgi:dinuclear metal center YbgI/SA1388 family protein
LKQSPNAAEKALKNSDKLQKFERSLMPTIRQISEFLDRIAPTRLAESWDNVGLLVGDPADRVANLMTCLTVTSETVIEAIEHSVQLIVTHHPLPFHPLKRITTETISTKMLWQLIRAGVAIYSPHTGFDSAAEGINQSLAQQLGLTGIHSLRPLANDPEQLGAGRCGNLSNLTLAQVIDRLKRSFGLSQIQFVGDFKAPCSKVAVACGSGGSFLQIAAETGCDTFVTGEANFHTCLEAKARNVSLVQLGHYASERFAVEQLALKLGHEFSDIKVWASQSEQDPIQFG